MTTQERLIPQRPLKNAVDEACRIIDAAKAEHRPTKTFILFSGGNDSLVLLDVCDWAADAVVHINTGIGVPQTNEFARKVGGSYGLPFLEYRPPRSYRDLVLNQWHGMPGPGIHHIVYQRLKERCVRQLVRDHRKNNGERFLLLTGVRKAESRRRMGYKDPINRTGGQVWANPLLNWQNDEMAAYRTEQALPVNEVAANLHMSGECLCGAMADQNEYRSERATLKFFYPEVEAEITALEDECRARGFAYTEWGVKRGDEPSADNPLCRSCEFRQLRFEEES